LFFFIIYHCIGEYIFAIIIKRRLQVWIGPSCALCRTDCCTWPCPLRWHARLRQITVDDAVMTGAYRWVGWWWWWWGLCGGSDRQLRGRQWSPRAVRRFDKDVLPIHCERTVRRRA